MRTSSPAGSSSAVVLGVCPYQSWAPTCQQVCVNYQVVMDLSYLLTPAWTVNCGLVDCVDTRLTGTLYLMLSRSWVITENDNFLDQKQFVFLEAEMYETQEHEYDKYCALIDKYSKLLHPHHYQLLICKRFLAGSIRGNITVKLVEKRLQLMKEFISVFEKVDPGLSKWRGKMLYQVNTKLDLF